MAYNRHIDKTTRNLQFHMLIGSDKYVKSNEIIFP